MKATNKARELDITESELFDLLQQASIGIDGAEEGKHEQSTRDYTTL